MRKLRLPELGHFPKIIHSSCDSTRVQTFTSCSAPPRCSHNNHNYGNQPQLSCVEQALSAGHYLKCTVNINLFNPPKNHLRWVLMSPPFCQWGNWSIERLGNLPKITQLARGQTKCQHSVAQSLPPARRPRPHQYRKDRSAVRSCRSYCSFTVIFLISFL